MIISGRESASGEHTAVARSALSAPSLSTDLLGFSKHGMTTNIPGLLIDGDYHSLLTVHEARRAQHGQSERRIFDLCGDRLVVVARVVVGQKDPANLSLRRQRDDGPHRG